MVDFWDIQFEPNFQMLDENQYLRLGYIYEDGLLFHKQTKRVTEIGNRYEEPTCGLVDPEGNWAILCAKEAFIWRQDVILTIPAIRWITHIRMGQDGCIEMLSDPWEIGSAIWKLEPTDFLSKDFAAPQYIRPFPHYFGEEYTENVVW